MDEKYQNNFIYNKFIKNNNTNDNNNNNNYNNNNHHHHHIHKARKIYFKSLPSWKQSLKILSKVKVWSNSKRRWFTGHIINMFRNDDDIQLLLKVTWKVCDENGVLLDKGKEYAYKDALLHENYIKEWSSNLPPIIEEPQVKV